MGTPSISHRLHLQRPQPGRVRLPPGPGLRHPGQHTPYHVVDVRRQWDGWCHRIPGDERSKRGQTELHIDYTKVNLDDLANQVSVNGT